MKVKDYSYIPTGEVCHPSLRPRPCQGCWDLQSDTFFSL